MNYIKVVWAGLEPAEKFRELHRHFCEDMNIDAEGDFIPHVTLGRVKYVEEDEKEIIRSIVEEGDGVFGSFEVGDVRLKSSELTERGPVYSDVEVCVLDGD